MQIAKILFIIITGAALLGGCGPSQAELAALAEQKAQAERAEREQAGAGAGGAGGGQIGKKFDSRGA